MGTGITCTIHDYVALPREGVSEGTFVYREVGDDAMQRLEILSWYSQLEGKHRMTYSEGVWHIKRG